MTKSGGTHLLGVNTFALLEQCLARSSNTRVLKGTTAVKDVQKSGVRSDDGATSSDSMKIGDEG